MLETTSPRHNLIHDTSSLFFGHVAYGIPWVGDQTLTSDQTQAHGAESK